MLRSASVLKVLLPAASVPADNAKVLRIISWADYVPANVIAEFKQETGIAFRSFRAWKRARHLLHFANQDLNLAHLAQDIGYPDSTHFSHSIRRFYGLKPRAIFSGSRGLAVYRGPAGFAAGAT